MSLGSDYLTTVNPQFEQLRQQTNKGQASWVKAQKNCGDFCAYFDRVNQRRVKGQRFAYCLLSSIRTRIPSDSLTCDRKVPRPGGERA